MSPALARRAPVLVTGAVVVLALAYAVLASRQLNSPADAVAGYALQEAVASLGYGLIGALVLRDAPGNVLGPLFSAMGIWAGVGNIAGEIARGFAPGSTPQGFAALVNGLWWPVICCLMMVPVLYPDGTPMSRRWAVVLRVQIGATVFALLGAFVSQHSVTDPSFPGAINPFAIDRLGPVPDILGLGGLVATLVLGYAALGAQLVRARRLSRGERARIGYLAAAMLLLIVSAAVPWMWANLVVQVASFVLVLVGILRHQLFDIQRVVSRSVVYLLVVASALAAAALTAAVVGSLADIGVAPVLVASVTAVALASGYSRILRSVERVIFGGSRDPARALSVLGAELEGAADPEDVLPRLVVAVRDALRLPYAGITLIDEDSPAAHTGQRPDSVVTQSLRYGGAVIGTLELGLRPGEAELSAREARLVATLAGQAGAVAHSAQAIRELRRSRERIVAAREEERRQLRRDLHDGLGPTLAGISLGLESVGKSRDDLLRASLVEEVLAQSRDALDEVRRIARELRPAALDEVGLVEALRLHASALQRMSGGEIDVTVVVAGDEGGGGDCDEAGGLAARGSGAVQVLPAAVEVAAYRIVTEAISNVVRHAKATSCVITVGRDSAVGRDGPLGSEHTAAPGDLVVTVRDDGTGEAPAASGTGLRSMRERAEELGGRCTVQFTSGHGTVVGARLPLIGPVDANSATLVRDAGSVRDLPRESEVVR